MRANILLVALAAMSGCAPVAPTRDQPCYVMPSAWNIDDQNPVGRIQMLNTGRACGISVSADRRPNERSASIVRQPSHGVADIRRTGNGTVATYTPYPGFAGQDTYQARFGSGSQTMTIDVVVSPPPG